MAVEIIEKVINNVLSRQPLTLDEYKELVENELRYKLNVNVVVYYFDEYGDWKRLKYVDLDDAHIDIYKISDIDELVIENENGVRQYFNIYIEGVVIEIGIITQYTASREYIMINCELKKIEVREG